MGLINEDVIRIERKPSILLKVFTAFLLVLALTMALFVAYTLYVNDSFSPDNNVSTDVPVDVLDDQDNTVAQIPDGYILLNYPTDEGDVFMYYNLNTKEYTKHSRSYFYTPTQSDIEGIMIASGVVADKDGILKAAIFKLTNSEPYDTVLYTSNNDRLHRRPQISAQEDKYLFEVAPEKYLPGSIEWLDPSVWSIYVGGIDGSDPVFVANGVNASFSPDGKKLLYVGKGGLFLYDFVEGSSKLVLSMNPETLDSRTMVAVSPDGTQLAISDPQQSTLIVYKITTWDSFALDTELVTKVTISGFWPVFSPDGTKIVLEQFDWDITDGLLLPINYRMSIVDIVNGGSVQKVFDFGRTEGVGMLISDWVTAN